MSLTSSEADSAFVAYCLAYAGLVPAADIDNMVIAAAIAYGAECRLMSERRASRVEVAAAVEAALGEGTAPEVATAPDATLAALEAYAEGRADELTALEKWTKNPDANVTPPGVRGWISARRAAGPKRGMTARDVLDRIGEWTTTTRDRRDLHAVLADLRAEIEGGPHV